MESRCFPPLLALNIYVFWLAVSAGMKLAFSPPPPLTVSLSSQLVDDNHTETFITDYKTIKVVFIESSAVHFLPSCSELCKHKEDFGSLEKLKTEEILCLSPCRLNNRHRLETECKHLRGSWSSESVRWIMGFTARWKQKARSGLRKTEADKKWD